MCGGAVDIRLVQLRISGLSPRVRGSRHARPSAGIRAGSIPACAGEPAMPSALEGDRWVYPRVCGGAPSGTTHPANRDGLSPRVRGSPVQEQQAVRQWRSIPACAGEPGWLHAAAGYTRVYPRVCGGAETQDSACFTTSGLSPRVRGSHTVETMIVTKARSIPACAGEPLSLRMVVVCLRVYPRVCGGAARTRSPFST